MVNEKEYLRNSLKKHTIDYDKQVTYFGDDRTYALANLDSQLRYERQKWRGLSPKRSPKKLQDNL